MLGPVSVLDNIISEELTLTWVNIREGTSSHLATFPAVHEHEMCGCLYLPGMDWNKYDVTSVYCNLTLSEYEPA